MSILEFFAAKWIFSQLQGDKTLEILGDTYISDEVLDYLEYFTKSNQGLAERVRQCVRQAFHSFMENGIYIEGTLPIEAAELKYDVLFCNLSSLFVLILYMYTTFLSPFIILYCFFNFFNISTDI